MDEKSRSLPDLGRDSGKSGTGVESDPANSQAAASEAGTASSQGSSGPSADTVSTAPPMSPAGDGTAADEPETIEGEIDLSFFGPEVSEERTEVDKEIHDFFVALMKTIRAAHLYVQGNPLLHRFFGDLNDRLGRIWGAVNSLNFTIHESRIAWEGAVVYEGRPGSQDNLAFQLYKDGIRRIEFQSGVETHELQRFIDVLRLSKTMREGEDDLLTLMWNADFEFIRYEYVDVLGEEPPLPEGGIDPDKLDAELPMLPEIEMPVELQSPTLREDFEPSLYFLGEREVAQLQQDLLREWERPVKRDVMLALLDQFEIGNAERRSEISQILRQMLPRFMAEGEFGDASFIVTELREIAKNLEIPEVSEEVEGIVAELSEPMVVEQLVRVLEDGSVDPNSDELATLLNTLKPKTIEILIQALPLVSRSEARHVLISTLDHLASLNPELISSFILSDDPRVASESAKIAARLKLAKAAAPIASLLERSAADVRLAAVEALVGLRAAASGKPLIGALNDENRDVRVAAARGLAELRYTPGSKDLERHVTDKGLLRRDLTEQLAFFEAYAISAGEQGVRLLARMLNGRRFLWIKYPSRMRACAARALGMVGGGQAQEALAGAERDRDPMVSSAVHAAHRGPREGGDGVSA